MWGVKKQAGKSRPDEKERIQSQIGMRGMQNKISKPPHHPTTVFQDFCLEEILQAHTRPFS